jgi:thioredoxin-related protein
MKSLLLLMSLALLGSQTGGQKTPVTAASADQTTANTEQAELIRWYTWEQAAELQKKQKRKILVDVYTGWCGWCKKMDATTYSDPAVAKILNEEYYAVKLDAQQKADIVFQGYVFKYQQSGNQGYNELASKLLNNQMSFPSTVFLDEDYKLIQNLPGFLETKQFTTIVKYFGGNHYKNEKWEEYQAKHQQ